MLNKFILITFFISATFALSAQNVYSKEEVDIKLELQQERINSKLDAVERENNSIDAKIVAQDKQIAYQDKQIENLKFIFGILLSVIGIVVAAGSFFIDKRNKERFADLEEELNAAKDDALEELKRIKEIADMEIRMAKIELNEIKSETKKLQETKK